jgi:hypothetical protein
MKNANAHLRRRFACKGDCQHLLRLVYAWKQRQVAKREQLGFSRTCGRLHQEGCRGIERSRTFRSVYD